MTTAIMKIMMMITVAVAMARWSASRYQCQAWLSENCPQAENISVSSTAKGAMLAGAEPDCAAAICSDLGSQIFKLPILQRNIMSSATNATRFLVLGHSKCERTGADNTLMTICIDHKPGAMAGALGVLAKHSNNLCAVESYPDRDSPRRCFVWIGALPPSSLRRTTPGIRALSV